MGQVRGVGEIIQGFIWNPEGTQQTRDTSYFLKTLLSSVEKGPREAVGRSLGIPM